MPVAAMVACSTITMIFVSLVTKPPSQATIDRFFPKNVILSQYLVTETKARLMVGTLRGNHEDPELCSKDMLLHRLEDLAGRVAP